MANAKADELLKHARKKKAADRNEQESAAVKEYNKAQKQRQRDKEKGLVLPGSDEQTLTERRAHLERERAWANNLAKATPEEKALLGAWTLNVNDMEVAIQILAEPPSEENKAVLGTIAQEVDAYVKNHPPTRDIFYQRLQNTSPAHVGFLEIQQRIKEETLGPLMTRFGIPADFCHTPIYNHFVAAVREYVLPKRELMPPVSAPALTATEQFRLQHAAYLSKIV
jgi:hypothetical protein